MTQPKTRKTELYLLPVYFLLRYDFIGHQETLQQDAAQLLKLWGLENDIKFPPSYENLTTREFVLDWFQTVPLEDRRKLYKLYEADFRLFGYPKPRDVLDGRYSHDVAPWFQFLMRNCQKVLSHAGGTQTSMFLVALCPFNTSLVSKYIEIWNLFFA